MCLLHFLLATEFPHVFIRIYMFLFCGRPVPNPRVFKFVQIRGSIFYVFEFLFSYILRGGSGGASKVLSGRSFWRPWVLLGDSLGPPGTLLGRSWELLGPPLGILGGSLSGKAPKMPPRRPMSPQSFQDAQGPPKDLPHVSKSLFLEPRNGFQERVQRTTKRNNRKQHSDNLLVMSLL